jgi:hypothetical protein
MIHWDYIISCTKVDSPQNIGFCRFLSVENTFFGRTHRIKALGTMHNS